MVWRHLRGFHESRCTVLDNPRWRPVCRTYQVIAICQWRSNTLNEEWLMSRAYTPSLCFDQCLVWHPCRWRKIISDWQKFSSQNSEWPLSSIELIDIYRKPISPHSYSPSGSRVEHWRRVYFRGEAEDLEWTSLRHWVYTFFHFPLWLFTSAWCKDGWEAWSRYQWEVIPRGFHVSYSLASNMNLFSASTMYILCTHGLAGASLWQPPRLYPSSNSVPLYQWGIWESVTLKLEALLILFMIPYYYSTNDARDNEHVLTMFTFKVAKKAVEISCS